MTNLKCSKIDSANVVISVLEIGDDTATSMHDAHERPLKVVLGNSAGYACY